MPRTLTILTEARKAEMREYARIYRAKKKAERAFSPKGDEARREQMREYSRIARALAKSQTAEQRELHETAKAERKARMKEERRLASLDKKESKRIRINNLKRLQYHNDKPKDWVDGRKFRAMQKASVKCNKPRKMQTIKTKKMGKVLTDEKPLVISNNTTAGKIALRIDAKTTVYIRPDQNPEAVRAKYLNR